MRVTDIDRASHSRRFGEWEHLEFPALEFSWYDQKMVLQQKGSNGAPTDDAEQRRRRAEAGARILEIQKRVKPDPEGWTSRDYINYGRR
jgi:hypothetical protein